MGRSSRPEQSAKDTTALDNQSSTTAFPFVDTPQSDENRAVTESESMARDIKEGRLSGFVGAGTVLTGETTFKSMLRVDGHLTGHVDSDEGTLIIGSTGQVDANINVASAIVSGTVNGDIVTTGKLELGRTARIVGNIRAPRLVIADGAILEGSCNMIQSKESFDTRIEEQKQQYATSELPSFEDSRDDEITVTAADEEDESVLEADTEEEAAEAATN
jgi:cytoskeletal protein CcmA (bactofilin family)